MSKQSKERTNKESTQAQILKKKSQQSAELLSCMNQQRSKQQLLNCMNQATEQAASFGTFEAPPIMILHKYKTMNF